MAVGYKHRQLIRMGVLCPQALVDRWEAYATKNEFPMTEVARKALVAFLDDAGS